MEQTPSEEGELERQEWIKTQASEIQHAFRENNYPMEYLVVRPTCRVWTYKVSPDDYVVATRKGNSFVGYNINYEI